LLGGFTNSTIDSQTRNAREATKAAMRRPAMDRTGPELAPLPLGGGGGLGVVGGEGVVDGDGGVAVGGLAAAPTVTETFMPSVQCPGTLQM